MKVSRRQSRSTHSPAVPNPLFPNLGPNARSCARHLRNVLRSRWRPLRATANFAHEKKIAFERPTSHEEKTNNPFFHLSGNILTRQLHTERARRSGALFPTLSQHGSARFLGCKENSEAGKINLFFGTGGYMYCYSIPQGHFHAELPPQAKRPKGSGEKPKNRRLK